MSDALQTPPSDRLSASRRSHDAGQSGRMPHPLGSMSLSTLWNFDRRSIIFLVGETERCEQL